MRARLCLLPLLAAAPWVAQAQHALKLGLKGGASLTSLTNRQRASTRYLWGFHLGGTGQVMLTRHLALQAELLYSQKGVCDEFNTSSTQRLRLHYCDVPVLAQVRIGGLFVEAGPQLGLQLVAFSQEGYPSNRPAIDELVTGDFNRVELGYVGGLGYQFARGPGLGLRYNGGLLPPYRTNGYRANQRNSAFQLYVSYRFQQ